MIYMQSGSFGKTIGVFVRMKGIEDSTKTVTTTATIYAGRPVTLHAAVDANQGNVEDITSEVMVYGLAKFQKNSYVDEVVDDFGFYGSRKGTVILSGIVEVTHNVFTDNVGTETTVKTYDDAQTYAPMQPLYVELTDTAKIGQITNVTTTANNATFLGYCLASDATNKVLQILLAKPSA
jgi:hypothetical protein